MLKKIAVGVDDFFYKVLVKNALKLSRLGYGFVVTGAENGINFEHIYNNKAQGKLIIGKYIDRMLLNLPAVQATRNRKDEIKSILWNEIENNKLLGKTTRVLDLASGGARYLREFRNEHNSGIVESICVDKSRDCVSWGRKVIKQENIKNIRFLRADAFGLKKLREFSVKRNWRPQVVIASGFFIYFNNEIVEGFMKEIFDSLEADGVLIFTSYEKINSKKLMRKAMATSKGEKWILYYRKPDFWRSLLASFGFKDVFIYRDKWHMNNVCYARK